MGGAPGGTAQSSQNLNHIVGFSFLLRGFIFLSSCFLSMWSRELAWTQTITGGGTLGPGQAHRLTLLDTPESSFNGPVQLLATRIHHLDHDHFIGDLRPGRSEAR